MLPGQPSGTEPADQAVLLLQRTRELMLECRTVADGLQAVAEHESPAAAAERIAYGVLVAALDEGLVTTLQHAMDVLRRFSVPAGALGEQWLSEQELSCPRILLDTSLGA